MKVVSYCNGYCIAVIGEGGKLLGVINTCCCIGYYGCGDIICRDLLVLGYCNGGGWLLSARSFASIRVLGPRDHKVFKL